MKKSIYAIAVLILLSNYSCKKGTEGNTGSIAVDSTMKNSNTEVTDRYVATDGTSTLVTFKNEKGKKSISIASNKMTIKAPETDTAGVYRDYNYKIVSTMDSLTITQGNNVIVLEKVHGN